MTCKKLSVFWNWLEDIKLEANRNIPYFLKCVFEIFPFGFETLSFNYNFYKPKLLQKKIQNNSEDNEFILLSYLKLNKKIP
jgi:hypothetical protein